MASASWLVTAAGWIAILAGGAIALLGLLLIGELFYGRGSMSGMWILFTVGAGPILMLGGVTIVIAGFKLMGGHEWARTVLEIFFWVALCASIGWVVYRISQHRHIHLEHVIEGAIFFLITGAPAILMLVLLHSNAIRRALVR